MSGWALFKILISSSINLPEKKRQGNILKTTNTMALINAILEKIDKVLEILEKAPTLKPPVSFSQVIQF